MKNMVLLDAMYIARTILGGGTITISVGKNNV